MNAVEEDVLIHSVIRETVIDMRVRMEERRHMDGVTVLQAGLERVVRQVGRNTLGLNYFLHHF